MTEFALPILCTLTAASIVTTTLLYRQIAVLKPQIHDALKTNADIAVVMNSQADEIMYLNCELHEKDYRLSALEGLVEELQAAQLNGWAVPLASAGD